MNLLETKKAKGVPLKRLYRSHKNFGLRATEELRRAKRYSEFLSLILLDLKSLNGLVKNYKNPKKFFHDLEKFIRISVRETDIVSGLEDQRLALLLFETPKDGAFCLSKRLNQEIKYFIENSINGPKSKTSQNLKIKTKIVSFPEEDLGEKQFLNFVQNNFICQQ